MARAKGVLGNDPFKRGAAARPSETPAPKAPAAKQKKKTTPGTRRAKKPAAAAAAAPPEEVPRPPEPAPRAPAPKTPASPPAPPPPGPPEVIAPTPKTPPSPPAPIPPGPPEIIAPTPEAPASPPAPVPPGPQDLVVPEPSGPDASSPDASFEVRAARPSRAQSALALGQRLLTGAAASPLLSEIVSAAAGLGRAVATGLGTSGATELDEYGRDAQLAQDLAPIARFVYDRYWRVRVEGAERIPAGPVILVANHSGALPFDGPVLSAAIARERPDLPEPRWLVEDQIFYAPFVGTLLNRLGAVRASPENAVRLLEEGRPLIVFPEGVQGIGKPFRERYRLMRFGRGGFVKIALRTRAPIVPVAIVGAEEASPLLARLPGGVLGLPYLPVTTPVPLPARWIIRVGDPIDVTEHPPEAQDDLVLVHRLTERVRDQVQGMLDAILKARPGVFA